MDRYITVVHKSNNGIHPITLRKCEVRYDFIRFDTEKKEFLYGNDYDYTLDHFIIMPYDIKDINPYTDLSDEEFDQLDKELLAVGDEGIDDLEPGAVFFFERSKLTDAQYNVVEKLRQKMYNDDLQNCIERYNNNFTIENEKLRKNIRRIYGGSNTPTGACYYDEDGKLYRIFNGSAPEIIFDSAYPDRINTKWIDN